MAKKIKPKTTAQADKVEREYTIPLRLKWKFVPRYKRANKAIKTIKEFLVRHMKIRDRDLRKVKIDKYLNEAVWFRGIKKPPIKVKVKAIKEPGSDEVRVELSEMPEKLKFKKRRLEKREQKATKVTGKKVVKEAEEGKKTEQEIQETEKKKEEKEKKAAVVEAGAKMEKEAAKKARHKTAGKEKQPKHQFRKALQK